MNIARYGAVAVPFTTSAPGYLFIGGSTSLLDPKCIKEVEYYGRGQISELNVARCQGFAAMAVGSNVFVLGGGDVTGQVFGTWEIGTFA